MKIIPGKSDGQEFDFMCLFACQKLLGEVGGGTLSVDIQSASLSDIEVLNSIPYTL